MSYYETWKYTKGELGSVASYVGVVALAFMKPDAAYVSGSMSLKDLQFSGVDGATIKSEIQKLQKQGQKVRYKKYHLQMLSLCPIASSAV